MHLRSGSKSVGIGIHPAGAIVTGDESPCSLLTDRSILQLLQSSAELIGARRVLGTAADTIEAADDVVDMLATYQHTDALQVAVTPTQEEYLLDDVVLVGRHVYHTRTGAVSLILNVFCLHNSYYFVVAINTSNLQDYSYVQLIDCMTVAEAPVEPVCWI